MDAAEDLLTFWFGERGGDPMANASRWFAKDEAFDAECRRRFGALLEQVEAGALETWREEPRSCLAYIVLCDQLSRNIHRGSARAFALDAKAQAATLDGMHRGIDRQLEPVERVFFYMPLLHAETKALQERSVKAFRDLAQQAPATLADAFAENLRYAVAHRDIVVRFGRFPHRNAVLGRQSTPEELTFLTQPGSSF